MGGKVASSVKSGKLRGSFTAVLASALLEWLLIFMLLVYGIFGFLITRFARYFELPIPCLICSRIDNFLGREKGGFYWDMICGNHELEISSLVYCHFHEKLVDVSGMCETCLFSFATKDKSNAETYRLLVGKLGGEDLSGFGEDPLVNDRITQSLKQCCCCNELWTPKCHAQTLAQTKSISTDAADVDVPSYREVSQDHNSLDKEAKKSHPSSRIIHVREMTEDASVHFGYTEVEINSDTESNFQVPDVHDNLEEAKKTQASSTTVHVRTKMEDPLVHFGYTELKITSDTESDIQASDNQDSLEEAKKTRASSTIIHVREKTEDPLVHFENTELKVTSDTEIDFPASDIHYTTEGTKKTQASSNTIDAPEKTEDPLVLVGYTYLNITSDPESDVQASDIEDARELMTDDPLRDLILESTQVEPFISLSEVDSAYKKPIDLDVISREPSETLCDFTPSEYIQPHVSPLLPSDPLIGHGLEELNWQGIDHKRKVPASTDPMNVIEHIPDPLVSTELISNKPLFKSSNDGNISLDGSKHELVTSEAGAVQTSVYESDKTQEIGNLQMSTNVNSSERSEHTNDDLKSANSLDLSDAYKLAVSSRGRQSSAKLTEQLAAKNSSTTPELKLLLSQFSRGFNLPSTGILSPRVSRNLDDLKTSDSSVSYTMKLLQKRASLERNDSRSSIDRNESGIESLDFSTVSEIEGESELDRLKRQLEHDRKLMTSLLKELEEERNASSSATNEAMAMITRLQEEKAALQMEASQEVRMMEEQAEYDMDALDKLNDLVTEKEKEIQNLEAELDYYRCKYPDEMGDSLSDGSRDEKQIPTLKSVPGEKDLQHSEDPWVEIQDEREHLSEFLRNLEKKLSMLCDEEKSEGVNGDDLRKHGENTSDLISNEADTEGKSERDESDVISPENSLVTKESRRPLVRRAQSFKQSQSAGTDKEAEIASIVHDVSRLNERLKTLEADRSFVERAINALNNGHEELIQEIASHLRELHKVGIRRYQTFFENKDITVKR